jgi:hypothetical protein
MQVQGNDRRFDRECEATYLKNAKRCPTLNCNTEILCGILVYF